MTVCERATVSLVPRLPLTPSAVPRVVAWPAVSAPPRVSAWPTVSAEPHASEVVVEDMPPELTPCAVLPLTPALTPSAAPWLVVSDALAVVASPRLSV